MVRARVGASSMSRVKRRGPIDDLAEWENMYPQGKRSRHRRRQLITRIISMTDITIITTMELLKVPSTHLSPDYLLSLSRQVDSLSRLAQIQRQGSLTIEFSRVLQGQFSQLAQFLSLYAHDPIMKTCSLIKCQLSLQFYVWQKANSLVGEYDGQLAQILSFLFEHTQEQVSGLQSLILRVRQEKGQGLEEQKDKIISNLRKDVNVKRQHIEDLEEEMREVQDENSKLLTKIITNAKHKVDYYSRSPSKVQQYRSTSTDKSSPRRKILARSHEDQINQILESKRKIEGINDRRTPLSDFLRTYFTMKYGKPMAEQNEASFREAVAYLARDQGRHVFIVFQAVLEEECDEMYFQEEKQFLDRALRCLKRYLNQKYGKPLHELDKLFEGRPLEDKNDFFLSENDIEALLSNIYKSGEVRTLQMILSELASAGDPSKVSCKRLIQEILDYEFRKHLTRVGDTVREISRLTDRTERSLSFDQLQRVAVRVIRDKQRCQGFLIWAEQQERRWTASEVIELIEKARQVKHRRE